MKSFGNYIRILRERVGLTQEQLPGFGQTYVSNIEKGRNRPTSEATIRKLVKALGLPEDDRTIGFLQCFALLNIDPYYFFSVSPPPALQVETPSVLIPSEAPVSAVTISLNATPSEVFYLLGQPDREIVFGPQRKWIYSDDGIHVLFQHDRVIKTILR